MIVLQYDRTLALVSNGYVLTIEPANSPTTTSPGSSLLAAQCTIQYLPVQSVDLSAFQRVAQAMGLLGILNVKGHLFVAVITRSQPVGSPSAHEQVFKVEGVKFFCVDSDEFDTITKEEHPCYKLQCMLLKGFYYSRDMDLTNPLQERDIEHRYSSFDRKFLWNHFMLKELLSFRNRISGSERSALDESEFLIFLIRGFVKSLNTTILDSNNQSISTLITIISRISCSKKPAFGNSGVDEDGNVSNFIETEFLIYNKFYYYSYTQIMGNVPVFYSLENSNLLSSKKILFYKNNETSESAFDKHFEYLFTKYGDVVIVNALRNKPVEEDLNIKFKRLVNKRGLPIFDFDLSKSELENSFNDIINLVGKDIIEIGAFCYDIKKKVYVGKQLGIFRIDSLNSIIKSGILEEFINLKVIELSLNDLGFKFTNELISKHNLIWNENNTNLDSIYQYSLKSKSLKKIYEIWENNVKINDPIHDYISKELQNRSKEYSMENEISIFIGTFNVNGEIYNESIDSWILHRDFESQDLVIIGLQEVIELTTSKIILTDNSKRNFWEDKILKTLKTIDNYSLIYSNQLGGIVMLIFIKASHISNITNLEGDVTKTGFGGISANKGAIAVSLTYSTTKFCFIVSHLSAGFENVEQRHNDYKNIFKNIRFNYDYGIKDHDSIIWFGDFNYRIDLDNEVVRNKIQKGEFTDLFEYDQLSTQMIAGEAFPFFQEMEIRFPPTYKFNKGTNQYDTSEKMRIPAWTDRILKRGENLTQLCYQSEQGIAFSDHKPVWAIFKAIVIIINEDFKNKLVKELYEKRKLQIDRKFQVSDDTEENIIRSHGLPPPSSERSKWWIDGGQQAKVSLKVDNTTRLNPLRPKNPFVDGEPDFIPY